MNHILRSLAYKLTYKRIDERRLAPIHLHVEEQDVSYFNLSTNAIISLRHGGKLFYFRECPRLAARKPYFKNAVDGFFETLDRLGISEDHFKQDIPIVLEFSPEAVLSFKAYVEKKSADARFIKALSKTDQISKKCGFSIWETQAYHQPFFDQFGLKDLPDGTNDIAVYFLWCMRSAAVSYRMLRVAHGKEHSFFGAVRAVSSRIVAEAMGLEHMITNARFCVLHIGSAKAVLGLLSDAAPGTRMKDCSAEPNGDLQRELLNLNVLDLISYQVDHGPNNYNVFMDENGHTTVCAFDNDNPMTFFPWPAVSRPLAGCSPMVDKKGRVQRLYFHLTTAERILNLDVGHLKKRLSPYLNVLQRCAVGSRLRKLKRAVTKTQKQRNRFLLSTDEFNEKTVMCELEDASGKTYLKIAIK